MANPNYMKRFVKRREGPKGWIRNVVGDRWVNPNGGAIGEVAYWECLPPDVLKPEDAPFPKTGAWAVFEGEGWNPEDFYEVTTYER